MYLRLLLVRTIRVNLIFKNILRLRILLVLNTSKNSLSTYIILWVLPTTLTIKRISLMITHISPIEITHMIWTILILILIFLWCYLWTTICVSGTLHHAILFRICSPLASNCLHPWEIKRNESRWPWQNQFTAFSLLYFWLWFRIWM